MGWWCEVRGELTFLIAAPPWLLPSTSQFDPILMDLVAKERLLCTILASGEQRFH